MSSGAGLGTHEELRQHRILLAVANAAIDTDQELDLEALAGRSFSVLVQRTPVALREASTHTGCHPIR